MGCSEYGSLLVDPQKNLYLSEFTNQIYNLHRHYMTFVRSQLTKLIWMQWEFLGQKCHLGSGVLFYSFIGMKISSFVKDTVTLFDSRIV